MNKCFLEEFGDYDQLEDEIDITMATGEENEPIDNDAVKEAVDEDIDIIDSSRDEDPDMNINIDKIDITVDTSDVAPKTDILDSDADDLVDAVEDITFDDFEVDDMIDAAKNLDVEECPDDEEVEDSDEEDDDFNDSDDQLD